MTFGVSFAGLTGSSQRRALVLFVLVLPWLNPWTSGPSPEVMPWLMTFACLAAVLGAMPQGRAAWVAPVALAWLLAALLSSAMGLMQYMGASAAGASWVNGAALGEAFANLRQRNQFASLTNIGLLAVLWWSAQIKPQAQTPSKNKVWTAGLTLSTVLLALGNAASSSGELGSDSN